MHEILKIFSACTLGLTVMTLYTPYSGSAWSCCMIALPQFPRPEHPGPPRHMLDLACRDNPKQQHSCTAGTCADGCPNKMGYTLRTGNYRYTAWVLFNKCSNATCPDALAGKSQSRI